VAEALGTRAAAAEAGTPSWCTVGIAGSGCSGNECSDMEAVSDTMGSEQEAGVDDEPPVQAHEPQVQEHEQVQEQVMTIEQQQQNHRQHLIRHRQLGTGPAMQVQEKQAGYACGRDGLCGGGPCDHDHDVCDLSDCERLSGCERPSGYERLSDCALLSG